MSEFRNGSSVNLDVVKAILVNARVCSAAAFCYSSSSSFNVFIVMKAECCCADGADGQIGEVEERDSFPLGGEDKI